MKKIGLIFKETSENQINASLKESSAVFILKYAGISGADLSALRRNLKKSGASLFVVKNSVAQRSLTDAGWEPLTNTINGPCGLVFIKDEPVCVSQILCNFAKEHAQLILEGGFLKDKILEQNDILSIARLPSKDILRAQVAMTLNSPISGFVRVLHQALRKFVYCLDQVKQKKEEKNGKGKDG